MFLSTFYLSVATLAGGESPVEIAGNAAAVVAGVVAGIAGIAAGVATLCEDTGTVGAAAGAAAGLAAVALSSPSQMSKYVKEVLAHGETKLLPCSGMTALRHCCASCTIAAIYLCKQHAGEWEHKGKQLAESAASQLLLIHNVCVIATWPMYQHVIACHIAVSE